MSGELVELSALDTARWGVVTAKAAGVVAANVPGIVEESRAKRVRLLIARCAASDFGAAQAMERAGFLLMDTLVYYERKLSSLPLDDAPRTTVRAFQSGDLPAIAEIARAAFGDYPGHYHADPRLDREQCAATYTDWATRSCTSNELADHVLVADVDDRVVAFATLRLVSEVIGEGVLFGVAPAAQGRGIYRSLMVRAMEHFVSQGRTSMIVSTQIANLAVQKVWVRLGFEPSGSVHTFHKWFDDA